MGVAFLRDLVDAFALGRVASRQAVREAFAKSGITVPAARLPVDAEPAEEVFTLLVYATDSGGQASFLCYRDAALPARLASALERMNGIAAAGPADVGDGPDAFALARIVALTSGGLDVAEWIREEDAGDPDAPDQAELDALGKLAAADHFVVNGDGSIWKHGPRPPKDLLDRTFSRVVSFHHVM